MEKGFNDEELADIMNEIESLEQEFAQDVEQQDEPQVEPEQEQEEVVAQDQSEKESEEQPQEPQAQEAEAVEEPVEEEPVEEEHVEEVVAQEEVQENKVETIGEPVEEPKAEISQEEANVHASIQQGQVEESEADPEMNEVLDELSQMPVDDVTPSHHKQDDNIHHFKGGEKVSGKTNHTAMSFHVEGDMKLELSFHIGDQFIGVHITDEGLQVGLEGGAKFTIPVQPQGQQKKAA